MMVNYGGEKKIGPCGRVQLCWETIYREFYLLAFISFTIYQVYGGFGCKTWALEIAVNSTKNIENTVKAYTD